jgi:hypothetical protein
MDLCVRWIRVQTKPPDGSPGETLVRIPLPWIRRRSRLREAAVDVVAANALDRPDLLEQAIRRLAHVLYPHAKEHGE